MHLAKLFSPKRLVLFAAAFWACNAMACYTVFGPGNRVLYHDEHSPVDMRLKLHDALRAARYPAGSMLVFNEAAACTPVSFAQVGAAPPAGASRTAVMGAGPAPGTVARKQVAVRRARGSTAPLMTTRKDAESAGVPYRPLEGNIVIVPAQAAARVDVPNMTVVSAPPSVAREAEALRGDVVRR
ncbi:MAG TPA: hypothetical protein VHA82_06175 [Ramlibacter sp.]|uniref:hypothetical protein n=1 Tax=Ramlibacter sp. TaxID=1917967 RepID=UPI002B9F6A4A|nr:hypothetical protein [Ramlibacter sp.]HVZ43380.1 hypothetical protein [Ramlibacter sp.]